MSFFQGMAQAFKDGDDQRFRMKVLGEEQSFTRERDASAQEHDRNMRTMDINARRLDALLQAQAGRSAGRAGTTAQVNPAALGYFGNYGVEDEEFLGAVNRDPKFAEDLMDKVEKENLDRSEKGFPQLTPQEVVETWRVYQTEIPATPGWSTEDLLEVDPSDSEAIDRLMNTPRSQEAQTVSGVVTNTTPLIREDFKLQVDAVNGMITSVLRGELAGLAGNETPEGRQRMAELNGLLEGVEGGDRFSLDRAYQLYGRQAVEGLQQMGVQGMSTANRNPLLAPIFAQSPQEAPQSPEGTQPMVPPPEGQPAVSEPPTQSQEDTSERTPIQQDFNSMEEAQAFLQTLPPGRYLIMVDGQEIPARVE